MLVSFCNYSLNQEPSKIFPQLNLVFSAMRRSKGASPKGPTPTLALLRPPPPSLSSSSSSRLLLKNSSNPSKLHRHQLSLPSPSRTNNGIRSQLDSASLTFSVGSPPPVGLSRWILCRKHAAISTSWLFFSAIPTLLAFKRAAESMEKLLDVTAEELPATMAAVRLSGMEVCDLTMELSDIGQDITQGVRSSTRAVRLAEDRLRRLTTMAPPVPVQSQVPLRDETEGPALARTARNLRKGIVKGRAILGVIFGVTQFSRWALNSLSARKPTPSL